MHVLELHRYPVKSMAGEPLDSVELGWHGLEGDRRWAFVRPGQERNDFPWLTIRERSDLVHFRPRFDAARVRTPTGEDLGVTDPRLAAALGAHVIAQHRGIHDAAPVSVISAATVHTIAQAAHVSPDVRRFRPNIVLDAGPFEEDGWVGQVLRIGDAQVRIDRRDQRCVVVDVDPETAERRPGVLRAIAQQRQACLGVYGTIVTPGRIAVGDAVSLTG